MGRVPSFDHAQALRLHAAGMSVRDVAAELGVAHTAVKNVVQKARTRAREQAEAAAAVVTAPRARPRIVVITGPCQHTQCTRTASMLLMNGQFRKHLALSAPGMAALANGAAKVCAECFTVATGRYPCPQAGCDGSSTIAGASCSRCLVRLPALTSPRRLSPRP